MPHDPNAESIALQAALAGDYSLDCELGRGALDVMCLPRDASRAAGGHSPVSGVPAPRG